VFASLNKDSMVPRWPRLDNDLTDADREAVRKERKAKGKPAPTLFGSTLDPKRWERMLRVFSRDCTASICCGLAKIIVIDADIKEKNGPALLFAYLEKHGGVPDGTIILTSQSGAKHYVFADRDGKYGNHEGQINRELGCNVRGRGGQIVAPGSWRADGKRYGSLDDLQRFIAAIEQGTLPELPKCLADLIGEQTGKSVSDSDPRVKAGIAELNEDWPDFEETFGSGGRLDIRRLKNGSEKFRETMDNPRTDRSSNRLSLASALKGASSRATVRDFAVFCGEHPDLFGEHVDKNQGAGTYDNRNLSKDFATATPSHVPLSDGEAFAAVDNVANEEDEARELQEDRRSKLQADIAVLDAGIERSREAVALEEPGAVESLRAFERLRKRTAKDHERLIKSEAERAEVRTRFLYSRDFDTYTPPDQLIENLIPAVGLTILVGDANVGKTFVLIELVRCLEARGEKFLGRNVDECGALLVTGEGHAGLGGRLSAVRRRWPDADIAVHLDLPTFGDDPAVATRKLAAILDEREAAHGRKIRMLALDNLLLMAGRADMNTTHDSSPILKALTGFANERKISIVLAAHENRSGREPGSYAWKALCDNMLFLKTVQGNGKVRRLTGAAGKVRDGDKGLSLQFKLAVVNLGVNNKWGNPVTSCVVEPHHGPDMAAVEDDEEAPTITRSDRREDREQAVLDVFEREGQRQKADDESVSAASRRVELQSGDIEKAVNARRVADGLEELGRSTVQGYIRGAVEAGSLEAGGTKGKPLYRLG
jgi:hypothetical protein